MISPELRVKLTNRYGIKTVLKAEVLEGGEWKRLLKLQTERGTIVLSLSHPSTVVEGVAFEHDLLRYLNQTLPQVPAPIEACDGTTYFIHDGRVATLFPFMPGRMADNESESVRLTAARMLGGLHQAMLSYPAPSTRPGICALRHLNWSHNPLWNWHEVEHLMTCASHSTTTTNDMARRFYEDGLPFTPAILQRRAQIEQEMEHLSRWLKDLAASGRNLMFAPIHGDYYARNLLLEEDQVSAVVDWDECRPDWLAFELARATINFCYDTDGVRDSNGCDSESDEKGYYGTLVARARMDTFRRKAVSFVAAYQEAGGPVPSPEFDLLIPFMRCVCLIDTLFTFGAFLRGEVWNGEHAAYHLNNLIWLESLENVKL